MSLHRHLLSALVLFVGSGLLAPVVSPAQAITIKTPGGRAIVKKVNKVSHSVSVVVDNDPANEVDSVELKLSSDGGDEALVLTESDAWLHGNAALSTLPAKDAALTLTLFDKGSAVMMTFAGTLGADGSVRLEPQGAESSCGKSGCTSVSKYDVEFIGGEANADGKGYLLNVDLAGADTYDVAYASVEVTGGGKAEVDWKAVGSVWTAESTLEHAGVIDVKAKLLDGEGATIENIRAELAEPWDDGGDGVNALSAGVGISVAFTKTRYEVKQFHFHTPAMAIVSTGWSTSAYPTHAELELAGGGTTTVPANSYHRVAAFQIPEKVVMEKENDFFGRARLDITTGSATFSGITLADLATPLCSKGTCVVVDDDGAGTAGLSVTVYGTDPGKLPDKQSLSLRVVYDNGVVDDLDDEVVAEEFVVQFDDEITALFVSELEIAGDPVGGDASGSVSLLGVADKRGRQSTLAKGTFYGSFSRDTDGALGLAGYGTDDWATADATANAVIGDPVECGGAGCDGDWAPPAVEYRRIGAYVVGIRRVSSAVKLKGSY